ncbi:MAG TPA: adenylate/guanylate cyclase domain-containing protein [Candidatus Limnocylindria bacterium]
MVTRRWLVSGVALLLPLLGLGLLVLRPELDLVWEHHPSHFWLVLGAAAVSVALAYLTNEAASRHADARLFLVSLAFLVSAGFLGLHALATPGALLAEPNAGFVIATPVGLILAAVLAGASVSPLAGPRARAVLDHRRLLRWGVIGLLLVWGAWSLLRLEPLHTVVPAEVASGPIAIGAVAAILLYGYAAWRYLGIARRRASPVAMALVAALVLLAEAMAAVALSRSWHLSWWEWHLLMTLAFGIIALATRAEYRRTGSLVAAFRPIYRDATLAHIDRWHGQALADIAELEARGQPIERLIDDLRRDGASVEEIGVLTAAAREMRRVDELFRPYLPQHLAERLLTTPEIARLGGETRTVTALFADLAGFTSFSETREPAQVISMLNTYWEAVVPVIDGARGSIEHFAGDGVLVLFNAFIDQPDHATRAADCGLGILQVTDGIAASHGWPRFRVGINTGPVAAGNVGAAGRRSFATIGDTTNLASRLMSAAQPGQIVIGPNTRDALEPRGAQLEALGPIRLKGKRDAIEAWVLSSSGGLSLP